MDIQRISFCNPDGGAFKYITGGLINAFETIGIACERWNGVPGNIKKFNPTIYIGATGWRQAIPKDLKARIVLHVNPYCGETVQHKGPVINETPEGVKWALANKPDAVFGYGLQSDIDRYWKKWRRHTTVVPLPPAGDSTRFYPDISQEFQCEIGFLGGRWGYKAKSIDYWLLPTLRHFDSKVYGWGGWDNLPKFCGKIKDGKDRQLLSSCIVGPSIHEPHSHKYGLDIPERIFKVPLCGTVTISEPVSGMRRYFPGDMLPIAQSPEEYLSMCSELISNDEMRRNLETKQRKHVLKHHTYFSRVAAILDALELPEWAILARNRT